MRSTTNIFIVLLTLAAVCSPASGQHTTDSNAPDIPNFDRYIGRELVQEGRGLATGLFRPLPLQCPPFYLRDEAGNIINPTQDAEGNPVEPGTQLIGEPISLKQTCGACHDYNTISKGYHFQMGRDEMFPEGKSIENRSVSLSPGYFGKWQLLYQRQLCPKEFDDLNEVDMTPWNFVLSCGICHPGGGPMEYDRAGMRYDRALKRDPSLAFFGDGDYYESGWDKTGVMEADCFICHLDSYEYSLRVQHIKKLNYKWAATAGSNLGFVWGAVANGQEPKVYYKASTFRPDGMVDLHIRRPSDRQCLACHDISSAQKRGSSWHNQYMQDVHTQQGITCRECHPGDIRHNFAKGSSSSQTVREDLSETALSCKECHEQSELGAPDERHPFLPALHLERISCEACHITHRPFLPAQTVDTVTGAAIQLAADASPDAFDNYLFGAKWGKVYIYSTDNILDPFTPEELERAASLRIGPDSPIRADFSLGDINSLPEKSFTVREFVEEAGGMTSPTARALMLRALETTVAIQRDTQQAICVFRGDAYQFSHGTVRKLASKLQPRRAGSSIAETPFLYGRAKEDGLIYPESHQLGSFWAIVEDGIAKPLFLHEMETAWQFLHADDIKIFAFPGTPAAGGGAPAIPAGATAVEEEIPMSGASEMENTTVIAVTPPEPDLREAVVETAPETAPADTETDATPDDASAADASATAEETTAIDPEVRRAEEAALRAAINAKIGAYSDRDRTLLDIFDDNNDGQPEINTEQEMAVMAWALTHTVDRLRGKELYYIRGTSVFRVRVGVWTNPYDIDYLDMERIGENEPFLAIQRLEQEEVPAAVSWEKPRLVWQPVELRLAYPFDAQVEQIDPASLPGVADIAQPLPWTVAHGVEPANRALGAGGCSDCHSADAHFFFGRAVVDPFTPDATPATISMYEQLGFDRSALLIGAWRETVLKPISPWIVLVVLAVILLHFALIGSKGGGPVGPPNVLRFRIHERMGHLVSMVTVVFLSLTGFCFLLGHNDPLGHWARPWHTYFGYVASVGVIVMFLFWVVYMFPAKGDLKWLLKGGGYLGGVKGHLPAGKFNAGQKMLYWLALVLCIILIVTGLRMGLSRGVRFPHQELVYTLHDIAALGMILVLIGHVYLAGVVVPHSLRAIFGGKVSALWARAHHSLWKFPEPEPEHPETH